MEQSTIRMRNPYLVPVQERRVHAMAPAQDTKDIDSINRLVGMNMALARLDEPKYYTDADMVAFVVSGV